MSFALDWVDSALREFAPPPERDVLAEIGFEPVCKPRVLARLAGVPEDALPPPCGFCPQERFLALPDADLDVLYGGAGGGGKSASLLAYVFRSAVRYPGLQVFWFRKTFPQLNQSILRNLARYNYAKAIGGRWNASKYELWFPGQSVVTFAHAKNMEEAAALTSAEINLLVIDERTTMPPDVVGFLYTRVRSGVAGVPCLGIRAASNPGHVGHSVVKADYVDATDGGRKEIIDAAGRRRIFIPAKATDNPYVGDYEKTLAGIADPELRARIRDGDWTAMPDAAFPDFKPDRLVVPPFEVPESWERYGGLDYGWAAPSAYLAAAKDGDGRLWLYAELTMVQTPEREQARRILEVNAGRPVRVIAADPAMWGKTGSALSPADQMMTEGLSLLRADNDRIGGKARMHTYLADGPACGYHRSLGLDLCPMLHVLDGTCPRFVATMPSLPRDPHRPEDVDTDAPDHHYDGARYLVMAVGAGPSFPVLGEDKEPVDIRRELMAPAGRFAVRPPEANASNWWDETDQPASRIVATGAPWQQ